MGVKMKVVDRAVKILNKKYNINNIDCAIVVGSGLLAGCPDLENSQTILYSKLGLPKSKVKGHCGAFIVGTKNDKTIALVSRMHYYESGDIKKVRLPLEIVAKLNCKKAILLTSCGGVNCSFVVGDIMLIDDQINMSGVNPLVGMDEIKFVNMSDCYNKTMRDDVLKICKENNINIKRGIFCQMSGPTYETNAEINMLKTMGADAVSMSTAHDCMIANYYNMNVVGFSVIVNVFSGKEEDLSHDEVLENANKANQNLKSILSKLVV